MNTRWSVKVAACSLLLASLVVGAAGRATARQQRGAESMGRPIQLPRVLTPMESLDVGPPAFLRIPEVREGKYRADGEGLAVAIIGSGINPDHVAFEGKLLPGRNFTDEGSPDDVLDEIGFSSHLAGIIVGVAPGGGIAPEARIVPLKVFGFSSPVSIERINQALAWVRQNPRAGGVPISTVLLPLNTVENHQFPDAAMGRPGADEQRRLIRELRNAGISVVASAGNEYANFGSEPGMGFPAICPETISVGAVFDRDIDFRDRPFQAIGAELLEARAGRCAPFSQRLGPEVHDEARTDVFAPGFLVTSAGPYTGSPQDRQSRTIQSGTGSSAAFAAGVVLLLQQRYRDLTATFPGLEAVAGEASLNLPAVDLVEECMRTESSRFVDAEEVSRPVDNVRSSGSTFYRLDAYAALEKLQQRYAEDLRTIHYEILRDAAEGQAPGQEGPIYGSIPKGAKILGRSIDPK